MRYLITGCAGFIGSTLTDHLIRAGHDVIGIDCFTPYYDVAQKRANLQGALESDQFELLELDLASDPIPENALQVDGVFHLAAQAGVRASWGSEFATYTSCNVLATQRLLEALVQSSDHPPRVVYASSSSIYGNAMSLPTREDALPSPVSPYGVTKLAAEHLCNTYWHNYGLEAVSLRFFTVYGERQRPDMAFHKFIRAGLTGADIMIYGDGSQTRDFTYVGDIVTAACNAMHAPDIAGGCFNLGGGTTISVTDVLELIGEVLGAPVSVQYSDHQLGDVLHTDADTSRAREGFGFSPEIDLREGLTREAAWLRDLLNLT